MQNVNHDHISELCCSCGLCCNGAMFGKVYLESEEIEAARAAGMDVVAEDAHPFLKLPCIANQDGKCMIYAIRFFRCKAYKCKLLDSYQKGQVGFESALCHVQKSVQLYKKIREELGLKEKQLFWQSIRGMWKQCPEGPGGVKFRRTNAWLLLDTIALIQLLGKHFLEDGDERWLMLKTGFKL